MLPFDLGHAGVVALFATRFQSSTSGISVVDFQPAGVVRGVDGASEPYAASVHFCPKFPPGSEPPWSPGALLAVAWAGSGTRMEGSRGGAVCGGMRLTPSR